MGETSRKSNLNGHLTRFILDSLDPIAKSTLRDKSVEKYIINEFIVTVNEFAARILFGIVYLL